MARPEPRRRLTVPGGKVGCALKICFFDLDGTLIDSRDPMLLSLNRALTAHGLPELDRSELSAFIGPPLRHVLPAYLSEQGRPASLAEAVLGKFREEYGVLCVELAKTYDGIPEVLSILAEELRLGVVTSKPEMFANPILRSVGLAELFEMLEGIDPTRGEAKEVTLRRAMHRMDGSVKAAEMCMVGDRHYDIDAGRVLGLLTVGVTWGFGTEEELVEADADFIAHRPHDLEAILTVDPRASHRDV